MGARRRRATGTGSPSSPGSCSPAAVRSLPSRRPPRPRRTCTTRRRRSERCGPTCPGASSTPSSRARSRRIPRSGPRAAPSSCDHSVPPSSPPRRHPDPRSAACRGSGAADAQAPDRRPGRGRAGGVLLAGGAARRSTRSRRRRAAPRRRRVVQTVRVTRPGDDRDARVTVTVTDDAPRRPRPPPPPAGSERHLADRPVDRAPARRALRGGGREGAAGSAVAARHRPAVRGVRALRPRRVARRARQLQGREEGARREPEDPGPSVGDRRRQAGLQGPLGFGRHAICSSPARPGSSARTSFATGSSAIPATTSSRYDLLTYAGNRDEPGRRRGAASSSSRATSATSSSAEPTLRDEAIDVVVNFAAESHNSLAVLDPGRFFTTNVLGTQTLCEAAARAGVAALPPRLDLRGVRRPAARHRRGLHRGLAVPAAHALQRVEGGRRPRRARATTRPSGCRSRSRTARTTTGRSSSRRRSSRSSRRPRSTTSPSTCTPRRRTSASGSTCSTTAARSSSRSPRGRSARPTTSARASRCRSRSSPTSCSTLTGKPASLKTIVPDRPGHDRRYLLDSSKIRRELGWEPQIGWEAGPARHGRVVPREPRLVGAAQGARARLRNRLALSEFGRPTR